MRRSSIVLLALLTLPLSAQQDSVPTPAETTQEVLDLAAEMGELMKSLGLSDEESLAAATTRLRTQMRESPPDRETVEQFRSAYRGFVYTQMALDQGASPGNEAAVGGGHEPDLAKAGIAPVVRPVMAANPPLATDLSLTLDRPEEAEIVAAEPQAVPPPGVTPGVGRQGERVATGGGGGGGGGGAYGRGRRGSSSWVWPLVWIIGANILVLAALIGLLVARRMR